MIKGRFKIIRYGMKDVNAVSADTVHAFGRYIHDQFRIGVILVAFLVTLAGLPILGIGATFLGLVFGVAANLILEPWDFSTKPEG